MTGLTWLHISDWHQKGEDFDREVVRDALMKDIRERKDGINPDLARVDFIVFSGDVAHAARKEEYKAAVGTGRLGLTVGRFEKSSLLEPGLKMKPWHFSVMVSTPGERSFIQTRI